MTAFPLNIQDRLQVKALLSVAFTITARPFFLKYKAHRAAPNILQSWEFIHPK